MVGTLKMASLIQKAKSSTDTSAKRRDQVLIKPSMLRPETGFNVRGVGLTEAEYWAQEHVVQHVRNIANAYIAGEYVPPIVVKFSPDEDVAYVRDGHHRLHGLNLALSEGHQIEYVAVAECRGDEAAQQLLMLNSSNTLSLTAVERAEIYNRLYNYGFDANEIAEKVGKSVPHVNTLLRVYDLPIETKKLIQQGKLSVNSALTPKAEKERIAKRKQNKKATTAMMDALLAVNTEQVKIENGRATIEIDASVWNEFMRMQMEAKMEAEAEKAEKEFIEKQSTLGLEDEAA